MTESRDDIAAKTLRTLPALHRAGLVTDTEETALAPVAERYAVGITADMAELIDGGDPADPMARQFVPTILELDRREDERDDPIGDSLKSPVRGLVHRYPDRALLKAVGVCAVYCRFCFRREMVGPQAEASLTDEELDAALAYVAVRPEIWEVIVSGGDPLVMSERRIADLSRRIGEIAHVKVVRWHTRVPVVSPATVTAQMAEALKTAADAAVYVAVHCNHPRELTPAARAACRRLADAGIGLVSQSVLLKGINDDVDTLESLMRGFLETGIKPYYLHHPDLAPGTGHFRLPVETGQRLMRELRRRISGLAVPTYVLDIPGAHGKVPVGPVYLEAESNESYRVEDGYGRTHDYRDRC